MVPNKPVKTNSRQILWERQVLIHAITYMYVKDYILPFTNSFYYLHFCYLLISSRWVCLTLSCWQLHLVSVKVLLFIQYSLFIMPLQGFFRLTFWQFLPPKPCYRPSKIIGKGPERCIDDLSKITFIYLHIHILMYF